MNASTKVIVVLIILLSNCLIIQASADEQTWWNTDWEYRKLITIDSSLAESDLTDFPVLISIFDSNLASHAQSDGDDITFVLYNDNTQLNHEIEKYDSTIGELVAWVNIPTVSSTEDTKIWMYYGNLESSNQENAEWTWNSNYVMVQHLQETGIGNRFDSTSKNNDGTPVNFDGDEASGSGKIDCADEFDGVDDAIMIPHADNQIVSDSITIEGWFKLSTLGKYNPIIRKGDSCEADFDEDGDVDGDDSQHLIDHIYERYDSPHPRWDITNDGWVNLADNNKLQTLFGRKNPLWLIQIADMNYDGNNTMVFSLSGTDNQLRSVKKFDETEDINKWYHFTAVYDGSTSSIYLNGILDSRISNTGSIDVTKGNITLGRDDNLNFDYDHHYRSYFNGLLDEIRISNTAKSDDWISSNYNMMNNPEAFIDIGVEETYSEFSNQLLISTSSAVLERDTFTVTVTANDEPIEDVSVTFNENTLNTNANGKVTFIAPDVDQNTDFSIIATKDNYQQATSTILVTNKQSLLITAPSSVPESEPFDVLITAEGMPIEQAEVIFNAVTMYTDNEGKATFTAPQVTMHSVYLITATHIDYEEDITFITVENQPQSSICWVQGQVKDTVGMPIKNAKVCFLYSSSEKKCTFSDENGGYQLQVPLGIYTIEAKKSEYLTFTQSSIDLTSPGTHEYNIVMRPGSSTKPSPDESRFVEYVIDEKASGGTIGARLDATQESHSISYYSDNISIHINSTDEQFSFEISADDGTPGSIIVVRMGEGVLSDLDNLQVTYDGGLIDEFDNIELFFDLQTNKTLGWYRVLTTSGLYLFIRIPHFSNHEIIISSFSSPPDIQKTMPVALWYGSSALIVAFAASIYVWYLWRRTI